MTMWQEDGLSLKVANGRHVDIQGELEASQAEVARMKQQIAATTAAVASARGSSASQLQYNNSEDLPEDSLIRSAYRYELGACIWHIDTLYVCQ